MTDQEYSFWQCPICHKPTSGSSAGYGMGDMKEFRECPECLNTFLGSQDFSISKVWNEKSEATDD